jgi:hypothetical protein
MSEPLLPGLRAALVEAAERELSRPEPRHRHGAAQFVLAAAAVVVLVALLGITFVADEPASAGVEISVVDGHIEVRLTDLESRPGVVEAALREAGIDATVASTPVGPSNLGRFIRLGAAEVPGIEPLDTQGQAFAGFVIDEGFDDPVQLLLGRRARPDEDYTIASDAYRPGEPLSCADVFGATAAAVGGLVADRGIHIRIQPYVDGAPAGPQLEADDVVGTPFEAFLANDALALSSTEVLLTVTEDGRSPLLTPSSPGGGACEE